MTGKSIMTTMDETMTKIEAMTKAITTTITPAQTSTEIMANVTGSMTMTDMEPENPGPLLKHMRAQNDALRWEIVREIADLPEADLRGVLRMIAVWKGRGNE